MGARVVIGSLAVRDPDAVKQLMHIHGPEKICLAADVLWKDDAFYIAYLGGLGGQ